MTKKHFIALADAIRAVKPQTPCEGGLAMSVQFDDCVHAIAGACAQSSPRFNHERWIGYVYGRNGKNGGQIKG